ncbi:hypothetical protein RJT34_02223 [Clitoria ternatea]|uniref:Uncharacterized protein n=1 Tax=Clitoria ternatea TaxID=43366 RepID=A0AAN9Q3S9_CLITE
MVSYHAISIPDEKKFVSDIYEKLSSTDDDESNNSPRVGGCICHVLNTLCLAKPEDFVPHFVGLGPYHHSDELIVSDKIKLGTGKRVLKILFPKNNGHILNHLLQNVELYTLIPYFYKLDTTSIVDDYPIFLYQLIIDAILLLALLHQSNNHSIQEWDDYYILTGANRNMPLLDTAGEELSMDGFIRDIFMLENQIPVDVL